MDDDPVDYGRPVTAAEWDRARQWARAMRRYGVAGVERVEWGAWEQTEDNPEPAPSLGVRLAGAWRPDVTWFLTVPDARNGGLWTVATSSRDADWIALGGFADLTGALDHIAGQVRPAYRLTRQDRALASRWAATNHPAGIERVEWETFDARHGDNDPGRSPDLCVWTVERGGWAYFVHAPSTMTGGCWAVSFAPDDEPWLSLGRFATLADALNHIRPVPVPAQ